MLPFPIHLLSKVLLASPRAKSNSIELLDHSLYVLKLGATNVERPPLIKLAHELIQLLGAHDVPQAWVP